MQKEGNKAPVLSSEQIERFMSMALGKIGAEDMITPREIIRDFLTLLNILRDNPEATFDALLKGMAEAAPEQQSIDAAPMQNNGTAQKKTVTIFDIEI